MKDERIKTNRPGQPPTIYGGRTFKGWASYYAFWGVRKPSKRTICSHYAECRKRGMSEEEIIAAQKRLWLEGITAKSSTHNFPPPNTYN